MAIKNKYGKGVLTSTLILLLLNSFDWPSYDSDSVVDVSKGRGRFWKLIFQGTND